MQIKNCQSFFRGLGKDRFKIYDEEMARSAPTEPFHSDNLHNLLDRSRPSSDSASIRRTDSETVLGDPHGAVAAAKQAQEALELPT